MPLLVSDKSSSVGSYQPPSPGLHLAICTIVADLGRQKTPFGEKNQVYLRWTITDETADFTDRTGADRSIPKTIGRSYHRSLHPEATLRDHIERWRGGSLKTEEARSFDLFGLLGRDCQLNIKHEQRGDKIMASIADIRPWPMDARRRADMQIELLRYSADESDDFDKLPKFLQEAIEAQLPETQVKQAVPATTKTWGEEPPPHDKEPDGPPGDDDDDIEF